MTTDAPENWKRRHEHRTEAVSAPYGPLALSGTHWIEDHPEGRLPGLPVCRSAGPVGRWAGGR